MSRVSRQTPVHQRRRMHLEFLSGTCAGVIPEQPYTDIANSRQKHARALTLRASMVIITSRQPMKKTDILLSAFLLAVMGCGCSSKKQITAEAESSVTLRSHAKSKSCYFDSVVWSLVAELDSPVIMLEHPADSLRITVSARRMRTKGDMERRTLQQTTTVDSATADCASKAATEKKVNRQSAYGAWPGLAVAGATLAFILLIIRKTRKRNV